MFVIENVKFFVHNLILFLTRKVVVELLIDLISELVQNCFVVLMLTTS